MTKRICLIFLLVMAAHARAAERPNVVWIVSEDNSIHYMRHFFPGGAATPNIEGMARSGLTFNNAFSNSPVCSVARTTLATSCYGPRIGTQFHRRYVRVTMPKDVKMFPAYLRAAGYYTTNNAKTDYNANPSDDVWNESSRRASWRNRKDKSQPFFHMESHGQSHESSLHFNANIYNNTSTETHPDSVKLADYFPDTPLFRYTHARYHDRMKLIDNIVGNTLEKLKADGLLEDTFVFYFGDHGGVLPRSKGYVYESGLHVPLVVRVPKNFRHLVDAKTGERADGFVSFVDFGPTVLHLAGIEPPKGIDGKPFLGQGISMKEVNSRNESFGYADRFDEKYDFVRSLRRGKFHYIRSYQPYLPDGLQNNYRYKMLAYKEWRQHFKVGKLKGAARQFFQEKPVEALYDVEKDPHEVNNLADKPAYQETLLQMRRGLRELVTSLPDLSFYPESFLAQHALEDPVKFGRERKPYIKDLIGIAELQCLTFEKAKPRILEMLNSKRTMHRYWAAMVCSAFGKRALEIAGKVEELLDDESAHVRLRAAEFVGIIGKRNPQPILTKIVNTTSDAVLATEVLNSVVYFRDFYPDYGVKRSDFRPQIQGADIDDRLNYINGQPYPPKRRGQGKKKGRKKRQAKKKSGVSKG